MIRELPVDQPLDLETTLYMGQDFRWIERDDGWHSGVLSGNLIHMRRTERGLEYKSNSDSDLTRLLSSYFRLDDDIDAIYADISRDDWVATLVEKYFGLRLLRQDPWECTVSYICSPQGIHWIESNLEDIAQELGDPIELEGEVRPAFPSPKKVRTFGPRTFQKLNFRFPGVPKYIIASSVRICNRTLDLAELARLPYTQATWRLMERHNASRKPANGIGNKVANCIALFALDKLEAFPVDVHIGRALAKLYDDCPMPEDSQSLSDGQYRNVVGWAQNRFGNNAGYASQFLFHEQRQ